MRNVVVYNDFREAQIRPDDLLDKYLNLLEREFSKYGGLEKKLVSVNCPACQSDRKKNAFQKFGFQYSECLNCMSLFVSMRPAAEELAHFYRTSEAVNFYKKEFVKNTAEKRDILIFKPRAQWIADIAGEYFLKPKFIADINSSYGIFLEEICALNFFEKRVSIEPSMDKGSEYFAEGKFEYFNKPIQEYPISGIEVVTMFEVIDRLFSPIDSLRKISEKMQDNGLIFITMPTISGFDLRVLWDKAKTIFPPDHLNILSIEGVQVLFDLLGFDIIELSTPGQLDVELVKKALKDTPGLTVPRFFEYVINTRNGDTQQAFQDFLQEQRLSSHLRLAAQKKKG